MKDYAASFLGVAGTTATVLLSHINVILATLCGLLTFATVIVTFMGKQHARRREKIRLAEQELRLCNECRRGRPPAVCPLEPPEHPRDCPLEFKP